MAQTSTSGSKTIYHVIPGSRMAGIRSFSSWKDHCDHDNLAEFECSLTRSVGDRIANGIVAYLRNVDKAQIPSVAVQLDREILHLPPKISYLFRMAARDRGSDAHNKLLKAFSEELYATRNSEPGNAAIALLKDIYMGEPRINSICCFFRSEILERSLRWVKNEDPQNAVHVLELGVVELSLVDGGACSGAASVFRRLFNHATPYEREMLASVLFGESVAHGSVADALNDVAGWGRLYSTRGSVSYDPEAIILLSRAAIPGSFWIF